MLKDLIGDRIEFVDGEANWQTAIKKGAAPLLAESYIKQEYVDSMISNVEEFGPYIIIADGVAMPHARPENGVIKTGMSFLKVENGVLFPDTEIPVTLFFTLGSVDSDAHLEAMMELADILGDDDTLKKLLNARNKSELSDIIK